MKSKLIIRFALVFLVLLSCTKQIDDSILDVDIEELLVEVDPILSTQNTISSVDDVYLNGDVVESFDYEIIESDQFIRIVLPSGSNVSSVSIDFTMAENASLASSISGLNFTGTGIKLISVVAENGDTRTYALKIIVTGGVDPMPSPSEIISVTSVTAFGIVVIPVEPVVFSDNSINVLLPAGTPLTDISFEFEITENSFLLDDATNLSFESGATNEVRLESEEGEVRIYTITVELENTPDLSDENDITKITATIGDAPNTTIIYEREAPEFDASNSIILEVPFKTDISDVDLEFELSEFATLQIDDITTGLDFTGGVVKMFTVIAQDGSGSDQPYAIEVVIADPTEREALLEMYDGPEGIGEQFQWDLSEDSDIGLWTGVRTNADGKVISIDINPGGDVRIFKILDSNLNYLTFLKTISIVDTSIDIPVEQNVFLPNIESVILEQTSSILPDWLTNQTTLLSLFMFDNGIIEIPSNIGNLENLERLSVISNQLEEIPDSISSLINLVNLDLSENNLSTLPASIADLPRLTTLDVSDNPLLTSIPQAICDWGEVDGHTLIKDNTAVCDGDTGITEKQALFNMYTLYKGDIDNPADEWLLENDISSWKGLEFETQADGEEHVIGITLTSDFQAMTTFDENLNYLPYLKSITVNATDNDASFFTIPTDFTSYDVTNSAIELITFNNNAFTLEDWILQLPNLKKLDLTHALLIPLNENIGDMQSLDELLIFDSFNIFDVIELPTSASNLNVSKLILQSGSITTDIYDVVLEIRTLIYLDLLGNSLDSLPENLIDKLPVLENLDIRNNTELTVIPQVICDVLGDELIRNESIQLCETNTSDNNYLTSLYLSDANGTQYPADLTAIESIAITIEVPFSTDITNLETVFVFDSTAISSVNSPVTHNFESPLVIEITAENLDQREYTISITKAAMTQREALLSFYDESLDTNNDWNLAQDIGEWKGVTTDANGNVIEMFINEVEYITLNENLGVLSFLKDLRLDFIDLPITINGSNLDSLQTIYIHGDNEIIPDWITGLENLKNLTFDDTSFTQLPENIGNLKNLESLNIFDSLLSSLPDGITDLESLIELELGVTKLTELSENIGKLSALEILIIRDNGLISLPSSIVELSNLNGLTLDNDIPLILSKEICDFVEGLNTSLGNEIICQTYTPEIQTQRDALLSMTANRSNWSEDTEMVDWEGITVDAQGNVTGLAKDGPSSLNELDNFDRMEDLVYLKNFTYAYFPGLPNDVIPSTIFNLEGLETLNLSYLALNEVSPEISRLKNLTDLTLFQTSLTEIPKEIAELESLVNLNIQFNSITTIPQEICDLENSGRLTILKDATTSCQIIYTPEIQAQRDALLSMYNGNALSCTGVDTFWNENTNMSDWEGVRLDVSGNVIGLSGDADCSPINAFNDSLADLTYLTSLYFVDTGIVEIPDVIGQVQSLEEIRFQDSGLSSVSAEITNLANLTSLILNGNSRLISVSEEVCEFGQSLNRFSIDEDVLCGAYSTRVLKQRDALLSMFNTSSSGNWSEDLDTRDWSGITVDGTTGDVIGFLDSGSRYITNFDDNLLELKYLKVIDILDSSFAIIPEQIFELVNLTSLRISEGNLSGSLEGLGNLINLTELRLDHNDLNEIPLEIGNLTKLTYVDFQENPLSGVPEDAITSLNFLEHFNIDNTGVFSLSRDFCNWMIANGVDFIRDEANVTCE